jgi:hypothetical protein
MTDLILHSYDASPFTQRVLKMLAIKGRRRLSRGIAG